MKPKATATKRGYTRLRVIAVYGVATNKFQTTFLLRNIFHDIIQWQQELILVGEQISDLYMIASSSEHRSCANYYSRHYILTVRGLRFKILFAVICRDMQPWIQLYIIQTQQTTASIPLRTTTEIIPFRVWCRDRRQRMKLLRRNDNLV
jgi:hypothetical protein